jgi:formamidopyrimidine-DNA glycosylase
MPELPEVETTIRYLRPALIGSKINAITLAPTASSIFNVPLSEVLMRLNGNQVNSIERKGKFMLFDFIDQQKAVGHLRMSGRYLVGANLQIPHLHFTLDLANGQQVSYIDQRRFGTFHFVDSFADYPGLQRLGPDALLDEISAQKLHSSWSRRQQGVYQVLLDQSLIAGLGNIYVNELLFLAKANPQTAARDLSLTEVERIVSLIKPLLQKALSLKGTTLIDSLYKDPEGSNGEFAQMLTVYGRVDQKCKLCGYKIERLKIGGRSAFFCPNCQRLA